MKGRNKTRQTKPGERKEKKEKKNRFEMSKKVCLREHSNNYENQMVKRYSCFFFI